MIFTEIVLLFQFKELVSTKFNAPVSQLCLIFAGRILKDGDTLASYCEFYSVFVSGNFRLALLCSGLF